ncbi:Uncharacterised protein [Mycobacteroides abscessus subsp. massiliense]|uniref:hypothetical protein n=1 Tax=Mycobacteriaceae TaxID=1762 RepID=UPI0007EFBDB5|nr:MULTISPECIES: hypothetical protein [Mycobacteriaceae]MDO2981369.1 hypothetical protein [Mycobacteroides abscessus subsp. abscessus]OBK58240.1 hypothetical protein A5654_02635 [Mycolicibacterium fortuitum]SLG53704.1 Uncharacterised protein [Mycobacteroides abscessus subsp. massiliense]SLH95435.1 Uncharacterised protein [Mycobacteroides abscessus subsp. massiliense]
MSITANIRYGCFTAALTLAVTAAACGTAAPAAADSTGCENPSPAMAEFCKGIEDLKGLGTTTPAPTTAPSSGSGGGGGLGEFVSDHAGWIVLLVGGLIAWAVIAGLRSEAADKEKVVAGADAATLARGRRIAADHHAVQVQAARELAAEQMPPRETWDPHGLGLAPPAMPEPTLPDPPSMADEDLQRYAAFDAVVPWEAGTAFAQAITRSGDDAPIRSAWLQACQLAGLGETDTDGTFTPAASVAWIAAAGDGDVEISVDTRDYNVGATQLDKVRPHLERTARVESASRFQRDAARDWFTTRLSMQQPRRAAAQAELPAAEAPRVDPRWS